MTYNIPDNIMFTCNIVMSPCNITKLHVTLTMLHVDMNKSHANITHLLTKGRCIPPAS